MMTSGKVFGHELSCLANYWLLYVSVHCCLIFARSVQELNLAFMPVASTLTGACRDCLIVAFSLKNETYSALIVS